MSDQSDQSDQSNQEDGFSDVEDEWLDDENDSDLDDLDLKKTAEKIREDKDNDNKNDDFSQEVKQKYRQKSTSSASAQTRLLQELQECMLGENAKKFGYEVEPVDDNLHHWTVKLFDFPDDSELFSDLQKYAKKYTKNYVNMEITFPSDYPFEPPYIRIVSPRFKFMTGHVTIGGSICMQLLTKSGWSSAYSLENVLIQIKSELYDGGGRIDFSNLTPYSDHEAKMSFDRFSQKYGWNKAK